MTKTNSSTPTPSNATPSNTPSSPLKASAMVVENTKESPQKGQ